MLQGARQYHGKTFPQLSKNIGGNEISQIWI